MDRDRCWLTTPASSSKSALLNGCAVFESTVKRGNSRTDVMWKGESELNLVVVCNNESSNLCW
jgi:hypothetical protein